jgi:hypothetical protein
LTKASMFPFDPSLQKIDLNGVSDHDP